MLLEGRGEKGPELPEDDRQCQQERRPEADPDRGRERLDWAERHRLLEVGGERGGVAGGRGGGGGGGWFSQCSSRSWKTYVTMNAAASAPSTMNSRVRSSPRCSTSVASSPWRRRRGTSRLI